MDLQDILRCIRKGDTLFGVPGSRNIPDCSVVSNRVLKPVTYILESMSPIPTVVIGETIKAAREQAIRIHITIGWKFVKSLITLLIAIVIVLHMDTEAPYHLR